MRRAIAAALVLATVACAPGSNPAARPQPGDNTLEIQIHAYVYDQDRADLNEVRREISARYDVTNGDDEPFVGDDGRPMTNWRVFDTTPSRLLLSQAPDSPARGIRVSVRAAIQKLPGDGQVNLVCNFIVNGVEDARNAQAGIGPETVCLYRTGF